ncbi:MAG: type II toxin-antitoxin system death-on-curing family toxin [Phycisphaerae bacterium]|nr:type II toxin-antitoxin system death-on-curing family toxin [Phycisphaerae bacterium]
MAKPRIIDRLTPNEIKLAAFAWVREKLCPDGDIPDFSTRYPNRLESCLAVPFQRFYGEPIYRSLYAKASVLFYLLIKNHPFRDGNKRIAIATLLFFLHKHGKWINVELNELFEFTKWVAESASKDKDIVLMTIEAYIRKHPSEVPMNKEKLKAVRAHLASQNPLDIPPSIWRHRETGLYWATYEVQGTDKILACAFNEDSDISQLKASGLNEDYIRENHAMFDYVPVDDTP